MTLMQKCSFPIKGFHFINTLNDVYFQVLELSILWNKYKPFLERGKNLKPRLHPHFIAGIL